MVQEIVCLLNYVGCKPIADKIKSIRNSLDETKLTTNRTAVSICKCNTARDVTIHQNVFY